ncbi:MAG: hydrogenase maturation nickel metallochaperone HypA [Candidatus Omnitrophica bacterium]|nr:hydrogenase maturation nickel metallochaperone HypA [Candidatus Omnitrophota bacterium]
MHEIGIAQDLIKSIEKKIKGCPQRIEKVHIRLGEAMGLDESSLSFCFKSLTKGTNLENAALDIALIDDKGIFIDSVEVADEAVR